MDPDAMEDGAELEAVEGNAADEPAAEEPGPGPMMGGGGMPFGPPQQPPEEVTRHYDIELPSGGSVEVEISSKREHLEVSTELKGPAEDDPDTINSIYEKVLPGG